MAEPILKEKEGDVTTIILNRPEAGNRQTDATWAEVTKMLDAAAQDSRVILFKGAGDDFCAGRSVAPQGRHLSGLLNPGDRLAQGAYLRSSEQRSSSQ